MLTQDELAGLDKACDAATISTPQQWEPGRVIYSSGGTTISFIDDYRCIKVTLYGDARLKFHHWYRACAERCFGRDRPRENRHVPGLGDRIIFAYRPQ